MLLKRGISGTRTGAPFDENSSVLRERYNPGRVLFDKAALIKAPTQGHIQTYYISA